MTAPLRQGSDTQQARIFLVDDHPIVIEGLTQLIQQQPDLTVCGGAADSQGAMKAVTALKPHLAIVDISLKRGSGLDLIKSLQQRFPKLLILVLSMHDESLYAERALRAGARGFMTKQEATEKLITAIRRVLAGEIYLDERTTTKFVSQWLRTPLRKDPSLISSLSDRELEVFQLIGEGHGTREIADMLHLSVKTIEAYREHIKDKLTLHNATELVQHAIQWVTSRSSD